MSEIHSFDVFDTALTRRVALPTDIFRLMARLLAPADLPPGAALHFEEEFVCARIAAENAARTKAHPREDCSLEAIWTELRRLMPGLPAEAQGDLEIRVERENIVANPDLAGKIRRLQDQGKRVVFISDIYHSRQTVFSLLNEHHLVRSIEQVYCSSDCGLLKSTGALFRHVAKAEGVSPGDFTHTGDHPVSDGVAARAAGLGTQAYTATRLNEAERTILAAFADNLAGSRIAGAMRLFRLSGEAHGQACFVSAFLGPVAALLAVWAMAQARQNGAKRLYFVARDGYVPWRAATELAAAFTDVECRYVRLSRNSLVAAIPQLGDFGAFWIEKSWSQHSLAKIAGLVGLSWEAIVAEVLAAIPHAGPDYVLANRQEIRDFVTALDSVTAMGTPGTERERRQHATLEYLRAEGLLDDTPFMIFDIGWYLNLQAALKAVIEHSGATSFKGGLYLGLCSGRVTANVAGPAHGLLYERPYSPDLPRQSNEAFDRMILLEHLLGLAPHGTAKDYAVQADGTASVVEGPISDERRRATQGISDDVGRFAALLAPFAGEIGGEDGIRRGLEALALHFFHSPRSYDLGLLDPLVREDDSGSDQAMRITQPWSFMAALSQAVPYRLRPQLRLSNGPTLWPEASLAATGPANRTILSSILLLRRRAGGALKRLR